MGVATSQASKLCTQMAPARGTARLVPRLESGCTGDRTTLGMFRNQSEAGFIFWQRHSLLFYFAVQFLILLLVNQYLLFCVTDKNKPVCRWKSHKQCCWNPSCDKSCWDGPWQRCVQIENQNWQPVSHQLRHQMDAKVWTDTNWFFHVAIFCRKSITKPEPFTCLWNWSLVVDNRHCHLWKSIIW